MYDMINMLECDAYHHAFSFRSNSIGATRSPIMNRLDYTIEDTSSRQSKTPHQSRLARNASLHLPSAGTGAGVVILGDDCSGDVSVCPLLPNDVLDGSGVVVSVNAHYFANTTLLVDAWSRAGLHHDDIALRKWKGGIVIGHGVLHSCFTVIPRIVGASAAEGVAN